MSRRFFTASLPGLSDLAIALLFVGAVWAAPLIADDPGVGWHLRTGQWISDHRQIPMTDMFLATSGGKRWIANQWLSDLLFWKIFSWGSWPLLHVFVAILLVMPLAIISSQRQAESSSDASRFLAIILCGVVASVQWIIRPVVLSFVLFAALYALLRRFERHAGIDWVALLGLIPLFIIWANLHPGFPMGFILIGCFVLGLLLDARIQLAICLMLAAAAALAVTLVNPYDLELLRNIVALLKNNYFMSLNSEWKSPDFYNFERIPFLLSLALIAFYPPRTASRGELASLAVFSALGLIAIRYIPFFALVAVVPLELSLRRISLLRRLPVLSGSVGGYSMLCAVALFVTVILRGDIPRLPPEASAPSSQYPRSAIAKILSEPEPGTVFLSPDWGGFLAFNAYPRRIAFIDDRNELSGEELYREYFDIVNARGNWRLKLAEREVSWILLFPSDLLSLALEGDAKWKLVGESETFKLFRRNDSAS